MQPTLMFAFGMVGIARFNAFLSLLGCLGAVFALFLSVICVYRFYRNNQMKKAIVMEVLLLGYFLILIVLLLNLQYS